MRKKGVTPGTINRLFGLILGIFLVLAGLLCWQGHITRLSLIVAGIIALIAEILFVFGVRIAQKDGFLDGYVRAKDEFDKKKKI